MMFVADARDGKAVWVNSALIESAWLTEEKHLIVRMHSGTEMSLKIDSLGTQWFDFLQHLETTARKEGGGE